MQSYCGLVGVSFQALPLRWSGVSKLRAIVNRLHHLANRIYDNVRPVNDDEMATLFRNYLLAVSRKRQKVSLEFDVFRTTHHVCADIHEWLIAQCLSVLFGDCLGLRSALHRDFVVGLKSHLISSLRDSPKMKPRSRWGNLLKLGSSSSPIARPPPEFKSIGAVGVTGGGGIFASPGRVGRSINEKAWSTKTMPVTSSGYRPA